MLSNSQLRIERTFYEAIRKVLINEGYINDITNDVRYPKPWNSISEANWSADTQTIINTKGFSIELVGASGIENKATKKVPRIVIITRRSMPGELGAPLDGTVIVNPNSAQYAEFLRVPLPTQATTFHLDIHLITNSGTQDRILNAIIGKALAKKKTLPSYDDPTDYFFINQYNYFDLPDPQDGITEKVYSYEVPDIFELTENDRPVSEIKKITVERVILGAGATINEVDLTVNGEHINDDSIIIPKP